MSDIVKRLRQESDYERLAGQRSSERVNRLLADLAREAAAEIERLRSWQAEGGKCPLADKIDRFSRECLGVCFVERVRDIEGWASQVRALAAERDQLAAGLERHTRWRLYDEEKLKQRAERAEAERDAALAEIERLRERAVPEGWELLQAETSDMQLWVNYGNKDGRYYMAKRWDGQGYVPVDGEMYRSWQAAIAAAESAGGESDDQEPA